MSLTQVADPLCTVQLQLQGNSPAPSLDMLRGPVPPGCIKTCRKSFPQPPCMGISPLEKKTLKP